MRKHSDDCAPGLAAMPVVLTVSPPASSERWKRTCRWALRAEGLAGPDPMNSQDWDSRGLDSRDWALLASGFGRSRASPGIAARSAAMDAIASARAGDNFMNLSLSVSYWTFCRPRREHRRAGASGSALAGGLIEHDGAGCRDVEGADAARHGKSEQMVAGAADEIVKARALTAKDENAVAGEVELVVVGCAAFIEADDPDVLFFQLLQSSHEVDDAGDAQVFGCSGAGLDGDRA